jgi:hypothetical protein
MSKYELSISIANDLSSKSNVVWDCEEILQFYRAVMFADEFIISLDISTYFTVFRPISVKAVWILPDFL